MQRGAQFGAQLRAPRDEGRTPADQGVGGVDLRRRARCDSPSCSTATLAASAIAPIAIDARSR
jgi:hypothetical protein